MRFLCRQKRSVGSDLKKKIIQMKKKSFTSMDLVRSGKLWTKFSFLRQMDHGRGSKRAMTFVPSPMKTAILRTGMKSFLRVRMVSHLASRCGNDENSFGNESCL